MEKFLTIVLFFLLASPLFAEEQPPEGMIFIPGGSFSMGSAGGHPDESPVHEVTLNGFFIDRHEVTNEQFLEFVRATDDYRSIEGSWFRYYLAGCVDLLARFEKRFGKRFSELSKKEMANLPGIDAKITRMWASAEHAMRVQLNARQLEVPGGSAEKLLENDEIDAAIKAQSSHPVRSVSWKDANRFARWAGKRLPTEAEWERAAKLRSDGIYPWGNEWDSKVFIAEDAPRDVLTLIDKAGPDGPVGMAGNVWEWTADWYGENYYQSVSKGATNPTGPKGLQDGELPLPYSPTKLLRSPKQGREDNTRKVIRGGGFGGTELQARFNYRCSRRLWSNPEYWHGDVGFRCARDANRTPTEGSGKDPEPTVSQK